MQFILIHANPHHRDIVSNHVRYVAAVPGIRRRLILLQKTHGLSSRLQIWFSGGHVVYQPEFLCQASDEWTYEQSLYQYRWHRNGYASSSPSAVSLKHTLGRAILWNPDFQPSLQATTFYLAAFLERSTEHSSTTIHAQHACVSGERTVDLCFKLSLTEASCANSPRAVYNRPLIFEQLYILVSSQAYIAPAARKVLIV